MVILKVLIESHKASHSYKAIFSSRLFCIFIRILTSKIFLGVNLKNLWCQNTEISLCKIFIILLTHTSCQSFGGKIRWNSRHWCGHFLHKWVPNMVLLYQMADKKSLEMTPYLGKETVCQIADSCSLEDCHLMQTAL